VADDGRALSAHDRLDRPMNGIEVGGNIIGGIGGPRRLSEAKEVDDDDLVVPGELANPRLPLTPRAAKPLKKDDRRPLSNPRSMV